MKLKSILENQKFTLEVTMPQSIEFVDAVLEGGAQALKMRCNSTAIGPLSAGIFNGPFQTRKDFLMETIEHARDTPVGLMPGGKDSFITESERVEMEQMGFDYFVADPYVMPGYMMDSKVLTKVIAIDTDDHEVISQLAIDPNIDVVEPNFVSKDEMDTKFVYSDILRYRMIVQRLNQPVIATVQRCIKPSDVKYYYEAGCKGIMLGVISFKAAQAEIGGDLSPETCLRVTDEFREAIEKL